MDDFWSLVGLLVKSAKTPTRPCVALWEAHNAFWTLVGGPQGTKNSPLGLTRAIQGPTMLYKALGQPCAVLCYLVQNVNEAPGRSLPFCSISQANVNGL